MNIGIERSALRAPMEISPAGRRAPGVGPSRRWKSASMGAARPASAFADAKTFRPAQAGRWPEAHGGRIHPTPL